MSWLGGNPFSTPVGQRIEQATDGSLASENWALNMEICDIVNDSEDGPKDAIKAIRKRLVTNAGKNYTIVMYTLTVLETCVKNCNRKFHVLIANKDFVQELVKLIGPKNDPPTAVQEKVLSLIQSWADAFKGNPELSGVVQVYNDLKAKGIEFPMTDLDSMAPIHTPQRSTVEAEPTTRQVRSPTMVPQQPTSQPTRTSLITPTPEQLAKLRSELDVVLGNMKVFSEMLTELSPGREDPKDLELLQELNTSCRAMQARIVALIDKVANEEVTSELLRINDELNNVFLRYERFERYRTGQAGQPPVEHNLQATTANQGVTENEYEPLIDFSDNSNANIYTTPNNPSSPRISSGASSNDIHIQLAGLNIASANASTTLGQIGTITTNNRIQPPSYQLASSQDSHEFDMFAQSRQTTFDQSKISGSTYQDNTNVDQYSGSLVAAAHARSNPYAENLKDEDYDEMEAWLKEQPKEERSETVTSAEFDRFLEERAAAAEQVSEISEPTSANRNGTNPRNRQMQREEVENRLFAL